MAAVLSAFAIGLLFGGGIALSGMANPAKVINFFDVAGTWDPSLALVMAGALIVVAIGYRLALARPAPTFDHRFHLPTTRSIDLKLVAGSAVFGVGWGVTGFCPGGAIPALGLMEGDAFIFVASMIVGIGVARWAMSWPERRRDGARDGSFGATEIRSGATGPALRALDDGFATCGQIRTVHLAALADQGFVAVVCARPDHEEGGQPPFEEIAREAEKHGIKAVYIPISGPPTPEQIARFDEAMRAFDGPVVGYCRSGTRAAALYAGRKRQVVS